MLNLSPDQDIHLADVLEKVAKVPVTRVTGQEVIIPDHIYLLSASKQVAIEKGRVSVIVDAANEDRRAPLDVYFRMLAESYRERCVAIILSGTGAGGTMGLKRIKEYGGATFVQNPREAAFNEMPQ